MKHVFFIIALAVTATACNNANTRNTSEKTDSVPVQTETTESTNADLFGTEWKLLELNGKAITVDTTFKKEPVLVLEKETEKLTGNGGCNNFMGSYKLKENSGIELSIDGATMMACPNLELEGQFIEVLKQTKSYQIAGDALVLNNDAKGAIAKLEVTAK